MKISYPLNAMRLQFSIQPFVWNLFQYHYKKDLTERARASGFTIWWVKFLCFTISYSRLV